MWGYYGSKSKVVKHYPLPESDLIIEPFAGTAQYSLLHWDRDVILIEKYEVLVNIWKWLQNCSRQDILSLPRLKYKENVDNFNWDCIEAKHLVGFIITGAPSMPKKTASKWKTVIRPNTQDYKLSMIADNLHKIKHWDIRLGDYRDSPDVSATWFIDPPYQHGGQYYRHNNKNLDYSLLKDWCKSRKGQAIVCENQKADWMNFQPLVEMRGNKYKTVECVYVSSSK